MQGAAATTAAGGIVAIDGKAVRAARAPGGHPLHLVSAWASDRRLVLGQEAVDGQSNAITAMPARLARLDLREQVVTIAALGCQRAIAAQIAEQDGDYVLARKANQPELLAGVRTSFTLAADEPVNQSRMVGKGPGRIEVRPCRTIDDPVTIAWLDPEGAWPGLRSIAEVTGERRIAGVMTRQTRSYGTSLPGEATAIAAAVRSHGGSKTNCPGCGMWRSERTKAGRPPAIARNLALNLLRIEPTRTHGVNASRLRAGWDNTSLLRVLGVQ